MQGKVRTISSAQLVLLLTVSRLFTLFTSISHTDSSGSGSAALVAIPLAGIGALAAGVPYLLMRRRCGPDSLEAACRVGKAYGAAAAFLFCVFCLMAAARTAAQFTYFMVSAVYQNVQPWVLLFWLTLLAAYAAALGLEAFSRLGALAFFLALGATLLVFGALLPRMNPIWLASPFLDGVQPTWQIMRHLLVQNAELVLFPLLASRAGGKGVKPYFWWTALTTLFYEALALVVLTALGGFAATRLFPLHTLAVVARLPVFGRLELCYIVLWVLLAFLRMALYLYCACVCLRRMVPKLSLGKTAAACAVVSGVCAYAAVAMRFWQRTGLDLAAGVALGLLAILFPLVTMAFPKAKAPKKTAKEGTP